MRGEGGGRIGATLDAPQLEPLETLYRKHGAKHGETWGKKKVTRRGEEGEEEDYRQWGWCRKFRLIVYVRASVAGTKSKAKVKSRKKGGGSRLGWGWDERPPAQEW